MVDREKVIKGLENIVSDMQEEIDEWRDYSDSELSHGLTCDCEWWYNTAQMLKDALALLKAQEPVKPTRYQEGRWFKTWRCGACGGTLVFRNGEDKPNYCTDCGRAVKWE